MKFRELMESLQGDFQIRIRKAQKGEAGEIMKEIEAAFKDKKINEKEFDMLTAMCGRKMDQLGESEDKKIQKAATKLVIKMKKDGEENKKIIKALNINFPSIDALRFLADFKNELVEGEESEELDEATYYTLDKHSNGYNALFSVEKTIHDLLTTVKNGNDFSMSMWNDIKKLLSKVEKDIKENK